jgi:hypothetical protein
LRDVCELGGLLRLASMTLWLVFGVFVLGTGPCVVCGLLLCWLCWWGWRRRDTTDIGYRM